MQNDPKNQRTRRGKAARLCSCALACFLALGLCAPALADGLFDVNARGMQKAPAPAPRSEMERLLSLFAHGESKSDGVRVGDWFVHPEGFAFLIPEGFVSMVRYKGTDVLLVDDAKGDIPFRTTVSVSVSSGADERDKLFSMTSEDVQSAYEGSLEGFELLGFERETFYGSEGMRLSFLAGSEPRVFFQQHLFMKNGRTFVLTMTADCAVHAFVKAGQAFRLVCDSLLFAAKDGPGR